MVLNDRYMTRGFDEELELELQTILWQLIDELKKRKDFKLDCVQVFELSTELDHDHKPMQRVVHRQEQPDYQCEHVFEVMKPVNAKVLVIKTGEYSTMLVQGIIKSKKGH